MGYHRIIGISFVILLTVSSVYSAPACAVHDIEISPRDQSCLLGHLVEILAHLIRNQKTPVRLKCFQTTPCSKHPADLTSGFPYGIDVFDTYKTCGSPREVVEIKVMNPDLKKPMTLEIEPVSAINTVPTETASTTTAIPESSIESDIVMKRMQYVKKGSLLNIPLTETAPAVNTTVSSLPPITESQTTDATTITSTTLSVSTVLPITKSQTNATTLTSTDGSTTLAVPLLMSYDKVAHNVSPAVIESTTQNFTDLSTTLTTSMSTVPPTTADYVPTTYITTDNANISSTTNVTTPSVTSSMSTPTTVIPENLTFTTPNVTDLNTTLAPTGTTTLPTTTVSTSATTAKSDYLIINKDIASDYNKFPPSSSSETTVPSTTVSPDISTEIMKTSTSSVNSTTAKPGQLLENKDIASSYFLPMTAQNVTNNGTTPTFSTSEIPIITTEPRTTASRISDFGETSTTTTTTADDDSDYEEVTESPSKDFDYLEKPVKLSDIIDELKPSESDKTDETTKETSAKLTSSEDVDNTGETSTVETGDDDSSDDELNKSVILQNGNETVISQPGKKRSTQVEPDYFDKFEHTPDDQHDQPSEEEDSIVSPTEQEHPPVHGTVPDDTDYFEGNQPKQEHVAIDPDNYHTKMHEEPEHPEVNHLPQELHTGLPPHEPEHIHVDPISHLPHHHHELADKDYFDNAFLADPEGTNGHNIVHKDPIHEEIVLAHSPDIKNEPVIEPPHDKDEIHIGPPPHHDTLGNKLVNVPVAIEAIHEPDQLADKDYFDNTFLAGPEGKNDHHVLHKDPIHEEIVLAHSPDVKNEPFIDAPHHTDEHHIRPPPHHDNLDNKLVKVPVAIEVVHEPEHIHVAPISNSPHPGHELADKDYFEEPEHPEVVHLSQELHTGLPPHEPEHIHVAPISHLPHTGHELADKDYFDNAFLAGPEGKNVHNVLHKDPIHEEIVLSHSPDVKNKPFVDAPDDKDYFDDKFLPAPESKSLQKEQTPHIENHSPDVEPDPVNKTPNQDTHFVHEYINHSSEKPSVGDNDFETFLSDLKAMDHHKVEFSEPIVITEASTKPEDKDYFDDKYLPAPEKTIPLGKNVDRPISEEDSHTVTEEPKHVPETPFASSPDSERATPVDKSIHDNTDHFDVPTEVGVKETVEQPHHEIEDSTYVQTDYPLDSSTSKHDESEEEAKKDFEKFLTDLESKKKKDGLSALDPSSIPDEKHLKIHNNEEENHPAHHENPEDDIADKINPANESNVLGHSGEKPVVDDLNDPLISHKPEIAIEVTPNPEDKDYFDDGYLALSDKKSEKNIVKPISEEEDVIIPNKEVKKTVPNHENEDSDYFDHSGDAENDPEESTVFIVNSDELLETTSKPDEKDYFDDTFLPVPENIHHDKPLDKYISKEEDKQLPKEEEKESLDDHVIGTPVSNTFDIENTTPSPEHVSEINDYFDEGFLPTSISQAERKTVNENKQPHDDMTVHPAITAPVMPHVEKIDPDDSSKKLSIPKEAKGNEEPDYFEHSGDLEKKDEPNKVESVEDEKSEEGVRIPTPLEILGLNKSESPEKNHLLPPHQKPKMIQEEQKSILVHSPDSSSESTVSVASEEHPTESEISSKFELHTIETPTQHKNKTCSGEEECRCGYPHALFIPVIKFDGIPCLTPDELREFIYKILHNPINHKKHKG